MAPETSVCIRKRGVNKKRRGDDDNKRPHMIFKRQGITPKQRRERSNAKPTKNKIGREGLVGFFI
jgi:hypothetical protein